MKILRFALLILCAALIGSTSGFSQVSSSFEFIQPENYYKCEDDLIEVMFIESSKVRLRNGQPDDLISDATTGLNSILANLKWHQWSRICDVDESVIDEWVENGERNIGQTVYNLNNIYSLKIPEGKDIWQICRQLEELPGIYQARPYPLPVEPPVPPNYQNNQGYLKPATLNPSGIDALYAWTQTGGTGTGITICDLEYSWNYNHADITKAIGSQINSNVADPFSNTDHGTAVIGQLVANNNGWGTTGICYDAGLKTCGTYFGFPSPVWNVPGALTTAIASLSPGDIILLEQQWDYTGSAGYVPIEWWTNSNSSQTNNAVYAAIVNAVANGIHVVEAGGNGNVNTGSLTWFGNSGAVIVGAGGATSGNDRHRLSFSSYGPRFDLQGWGQSVTTTGYGGLYNAEGINYYYTTTFSGTSSASPIVSGAIACTQGFYLANVSATPLTPSQMKSHLVTYSHPQVFGISGNIGPRPDLNLGIVALQPPPPNQYDWGDAPDPTYPTLSTNNGARHYIDYTIYLGNGVDADTDGQPTIHALGDDNDGNDDEDGVFFTSLIMANQSATITVFASANGFVNAWFDFNFNGSWNDPGEQVFTDVPVVPGPNNLVFFVPSVPATQLTFTRFRYSTLPGLAPTGLAPDGEVEDYEIIINVEIGEEIDWGDAPDGPYPTISANNGASHMIAPGFFLGNFVDPEPDGQPGPNANCDDTDCLYPSLGDDEDGVTFNFPILPGQNTNISVIASATGFLNVWVDQDINGSWADPGDHVLVDVLVVPGANALSFIASPGGYVGNTYTRFRFSSLPGLTYTGQASDGEVEDYMIYIGEEDPSEFDFGDAPEDPSGNYPVTLGFNGAHHSIVPGIYLGNLVDPEPDGQPSPGADCDDMDCFFPSLGDDEDGVSMPALINPGAAIDITVTASVDGFLDLWVDFNVDNDWADPDDHVFINTSLIAGPNVLTFIVPGGAVPGQSYARFRFRDYNTNISYDGYVQNGEVEDYSVFIQEVEQEYDFGDAPENAAGDYPTTLAFNGARHIYDPTIFLGSFVDPEPDGQPGINADCDDTDCLYPSLGDDEDGVNLPAFFAPGSTQIIDVTASVNGYLDIWMDFNGNNSWADAGEHILANSVTGVGLNTILFFVPINAVPGQSYMRFRFRDYSSNISYDGLVQNGEVEDYAVYIGETEPEFDFGDAPENAVGDYPTTLAHNGAHHTVVPGIFLGNLVDAEPDGQPGPGANCDDNDCLFPSLGDDEDGVVIPSSVSKGLDITILVTASVDGYLDAWMDFNINASWADAGEHIFTNTFLIAGAITPLTITIPANAATGQSYARFRFRDYTGNISFDGYVQNGEVEDYAIYIEESDAEFDFGDAPENAAGDYPTTLAHNGAHHIVVPGIFLGNFVDAEPDGQAGINADCDDLDCLFPSLGDDEDGVTWAGPVSPGSTVPVTVVASIDGYLDVWMDFNLDMDWDDTDEHVFTSLFIVAGPNLLNITIPATADTGQSIVRFRFRDYSGPINYDGLVQNGEVEDYAVHIALSEIKLDVKVILGGAVLPGWNPGDPAIMDTTLNVLGYLPLSQPYNDPAAIWYYTGSEQVPVMNKADIVDWVKIELRETANGPSTATAATKIAEQAVFILNDGSLVALDGATVPRDAVIPKVDVYLVMWHRNHLAIMSANPMTNLGGGVFSYDFTSGPNQAYGTNAQIQIAPGYYGMIPADSEPDGQVDSIDYAIWRSHAGTSGYLGADMNLDGHVDNVDKNDDWVPNKGKGIQIP